MPIGDRLLCSARVRFDRQLPLGPPLVLVRRLESEFVPAGRAVAIHDGRNAQHVAIGSQGSHCEVAHSASWQVTTRAVLLKP